MTPSMVNSERRRIDWVKTLRLTKLGGAFFMTFALGGWYARIHDHAGQLPYLKRIANQHEAEERTLGANPVATVNCLRKKTDVAVRIAHQAIEVAKDASPDEVVPNLGGLPTCPKDKSVLK